jgi:hypothetical protein
LENTEGAAGIRRGELEISFFGFKRFEIPDKDNIGFDGKICELPV